MARLGGSICSCAFGPRQLRPCRHASTLESTDQARSRPQTLLHTNRAGSMCTASLQVLQASTICRTFPQHVVSRQHKMCATCTEHNRRAQAPHPACHVPWQQPVIGGHAWPSWQVLNTFDLPATNSTHVISEPIISAGLSNPCQESRRCSSKQASQNHTPVPQDVRYRLASDQLVDPKRYTAAAAV